jgi:hypothetical protein
VPYQLHARHPVAGTQKAEKAQKRSSVGVQAAVGGVDRRPNGRGRGVRGARWSR